MSVYCIAYQGWSSCTWCKRLEDGCNDVFIIFIGSECSSAASVRKRQSAVSNCTDLDQ
jgi:hypothetical protein